MRNKGFEGWYFKHQSGGDVVAFIPGRAESGAFVQMICADGSRQFEVPELSAGPEGIRAGHCLFSREGCVIDLPGVSGELRYGKLTPLKSDIMGPFRFFPMECRHGVISMAHTMSGSLVIDGVRHDFSGGKGYIEKDSGISFPSAYLWLQCVDFQEPCSILVSCARIPLCGLSFRGFICAVVFRGREYRLATYTVARVCAAGAEHVCLAGSGLFLEVDVKPSEKGHELRSPVCGQMTGIIRESSSAALRARLWENGEPVFDLRSANASYEYVPDRLGKSTGEI